MVELVAGITWAQCSQSSQSNTSKKFARGTATSPWLPPRLHARGLFETLRAYRQNSTSMAQQAGDSFDRSSLCSFGPSHKKTPVGRFARR